MGLQKAKIIARISFCCVFLSSLKSILFVYTGRVAYCARGVGFLRFSFDSFCVEAAASVKSLWVLHFSALCAAQCQQAKCTVEAEGVCPLPQLRLPGVGCTREPCTWRPKQKVSSFSPQGLRDIVWKWKCIKVSEGCSSVQKPSSKQAHTHIHAQAQVHRVWWRLRRLRCECAEHLPMDTFAICEKGELLRALPAWQLFSQCLAWSRH